MPLLLWVGFWCLVAIWEMAEESHGHSFQFFPSESCCPLIPLPAFFLSSLEVKAVLCNLLKVDRLISALPSNKIFLTAFVPQREQTQWIPLGLIHTCICPMISRHGSKKYFFYPTTSPRKTCCLALSRNKHPSGFLIQQSTAGFPRESGGIK